MNGIKTACVVMEIIRKLGIDCAIAGGAVRDSYFGKEPKDIDIVVWNCTTQAQALALQNELTALGFVYNNVKAESLDPEYKDCRCAGVWEFGTSFDVILYGSSYTTEEQVMEAFDFNINQFVSSDGKEMRQYIQDGHKDGVLSQLRETVSKQRTAKIVAYAQSVGWDTTAVEEKMFKDDQVVTDEDVGDFVKELHEQANGSNSPLNRICEEVDENGLALNRESTAHWPQDKK